MHRVFHGRVCARTDLAPHVAGSGPIVCDAKELDPMNHVGHTIAQLHREQAWRARLLYSVQFSASTSLGGRIVTFPIIVVVHLRNAMNVGIGAVASPSTRSSR